MPGSGTQIQRSPWEVVLRESVRNSLHGDQFWRRLLTPDARLHLAVLVEPYLTLLLSGKKTMESRFSMTRRPPFRRVRRKDILILKRSAGLIAGICQVVDVDFYHLDSAALADLRARFHHSLAIQHDS